MGSSPSSVRSRSRRRVDLRGCEAPRIATAPRLLESHAARDRVSEWLKQVPDVEARSLEALFAGNSSLTTLVESLAETSPYL